MTMTLREHAIHAVIFKTREDALVWARTVVQPRRVA